MPKVVDHDERRRELAHAVWRVIRRQGVEQASVRTVALEAGCSPGALRHYFATQTELLAFAMRLVVERIEDRIAAIEWATDPREAVEQLLHELLPLDVERRAENEVWLAFAARALIDPALRDQYDEVHTALHQACASSLAALAAVPAPAHEVQRLHSLIDGLAVHTALRPDLMTPQLIIAVVRLHLDALNGTRGPASSS